MISGWRNRAACRLFGLNRAKLLPDYEQGLGARMPLRWLAVRRGPATRVLFTFQPLAVNRDEWLADSGPKGGRVQYCDDNNTRENKTFAIVDTA